MGEGDSNLKKLGNHENLQVGRIVHQLKNKRLFYFENAQENLFMNIDAPWKFLTARGWYLLEDKLAQETRKNHESKKSANMRLRVQERTWVLKDSELKLFVSLICYWVWQWKEDKDYQDGVLCILWEGEWGCCRKWWCHVWPPEECYTNCKWSNHPDLITKTTRCVSCRVHLATYAQRKKIKIESLCIFKFWRLLSIWYCCNLIKVRMDEVLGL